LRLVSLVTNASDTFRYHSQRLLQSRRGSRTCEIGMSRSTGQIYRSYMYLLEKATR